MATSPAGQRLSFRAKPSSGSATEAKAAHVIASVRILVLWNIGVFLAALVCGSAGSGRSGQFLS